MKSNPHEWTVRNERAMKRLRERPALAIHDAMMEAREAIVDQITAYMQSPVRTERFPNYGSLRAEELSWYVGIVYDLLMAAVRAGDRTLLLHYIHDIARRRFAKGFPPAEVCDALLVISEILTEELLHKPEVSSFTDAVRDSVVLSVALAADGVQVAFDAFREAAPAGDAMAAVSHSSEELERIVQKLNAFYRTPDRTSNADGSGAPRHDRPHERIGV